MLHALEAWANFYVIVGSSAGALTGLQFVVVALVADTHNTRDFSNASSTFSTPTVVHFSFVLVLSAMLAAPWGRAGIAMTIVGASGLGGVIYSIVVGRRARRQDHYRPVLEDWLFHVYVPGAAYLMMTIAALVSRAHIEGGLFVVAGSALLLLIAGIHNAWDTVTFIVARQADRAEPQEARSVESDRRSGGRSGSDQNRGEAERRG